MDFKDGNFLSCLSGSEAGVSNIQSFAVFLSCLSGSEDLSQSSTLQSDFLSCLSGSEVVIILNLKYG